MKNEIKRIEEIQNQIETLKNKKNKAEGALDQVMEQLRTEYGINSIEEAEEYLKEQEKEKEKDIKKRKELLDELEELADWDSIGEDGEEEEDDEY